jgi:GTP-binding protein LepA
MDRHHIRNFSIIAHIDHGKSTLADRMLELTGTIERRKMRDQVLDSMELERERGITIKMQPVRMSFSTKGETYELNLIDTPGHIDFSYEVSRALKAVEGSLLLVDATRGVQAQTLTTLAMARESGLTIIPVLSKIDSPLARVQDVKEEMKTLLSCTDEDIIETSGKTGDGVRELLETIIERIPPPRPPESDDFRALVFDFSYSNHRGVIVYVRVFDGQVTKATSLMFRGAKERFSSLETGIFLPDETPTDTLGPGEIGYIVTGIKQPGIASVGDTITKEKSPIAPLPGYQHPRPVVWASVYPESQDNFADLRQALDRLRLSDSSLTYEEESSGALGRGYRCGFLGMLHLEIVIERLQREFNLELIVTSPSITYEVVKRGGQREKIYTPAKFPEHGEILQIFEPWVSMQIITPPEHLNKVMQLLYDYESLVGDSETFGDERIVIHAQMPLRELMRHFFEKLKNVSSGYASISYEIGELKEADVTKLDVLVAEEPVPAFSRVVARRRLQEEAEAVVEKLHSILPKQLFVTKIQGKALGRILASRTLKALKKDVTGYLYGGDITRKRKLWEKQKRGKKRMLAQGKVNIPQDVFMKMMQAD